MSAHGSQAARPVPTAPPDWGRGASRQDAGPQRVGHHCQLLRVKPPPRCRARGTASTSPMRGTHGCVRRTSRPRQRIGAETGSERSRRRLEVTQPQLLGSWSQEGLPWVDDHVRGTLRVEGAVGSPAGAAESPPRPRRSAAAPGVTCCFTLR